MFVIQTFLNAYEMNKFSNGGEEILVALVQKRRKIFTDFANVPRM